MTRVLRGEEEKFNAACNTLRLASWYPGEYAAIDVLDIDLEHSTQGEQATYTTYVFRKDPDFGWLLEDKHPSEEDP